MLWLCSTGVDIVLESIGIFHSKYKSSLVQPTRCRLPNVEPRTVRRSGILGMHRKRAGVVGGVHNRTPPAARRVGEISPLEVHYLRKIKSISTVAEQSLC